jgi:hypothetical protein
MGYYSVIKNKKIMWFGRKWMELVITMLSEIHQTKKDKYCVFFSYAKSRLKKDERIESKLYDERQEY